jgi:hypothetical protein
MFEFFKKITGHDNEDSESSTVVFSPEDVNTIDLFLRNNLMIKDKKHDTPKIPGKFFEHSGDTIALLVSIVETSKLKLTFIDEVLNGIIIMPSE